MNRRTEKCILLYLRTQLDHREQKRLLLDHGELDTSLLGTCVKMKHKRRLKFISLHWPPFTYNFHGYQQNNTILRRNCSSKYLLGGPQLSGRFQKANLQFQFVNRVRILGFGRSEQNECIHYSHTSSDTQLCYDLTNRKPNVSETKTKLTYITSYMSL